MRKIELSDIKPGDLMCLNPGDKSMYDLVSIGEKELYPYKFTFEHVYQCFFSRRFLISQGATFYTNRPSLPPIETIDIEKVECCHKVKEYIGLVERFNYCELCNYKLL